MADDSPMAAPFPESTRVVYARNPLIAVICQVRFPPILRISAETPVAFQEQVRSEYPLLSEKYPETNIQIPKGVPAGIAELVKRVVPDRKLLGYEFVSADEEWRATLTRETLALSTPEYRRWEKFREHLEGPLKTLAAVYSPAFFTRVGLRYQNLIQRSKLGLAGTMPWSQLVKAHISGILAVPDLAGSVEQCASQTVINLPRFKGKVRISYGIVQAGDTNEECFLIDSDFYTEERTNINAVDGILGYFNRQSGSLFRWCIEDQLDVAMEPQPVAAAA